MLLILSPQDSAYKIGHIYPLYSKQILKKSETGNIVFDCEICVRSISGSAPEGMENCKMSGKIVEKSRGILRWMISGNPDLSISEKYLAI